MTAAKYTCVWTHDKTETWTTTCKKSFFIAGGKIEDSGFNYCPYCGKHLQTAEKPVVVNPKG